MDRLDFCIHSFIAGVQSPPYRSIYVTHATRALQSYDLSGEGIKFRSHRYFLTTHGHGEPPRMRDQLNAGATSKTAWTWKTILTIYAPIHSNKAIMKGWFWRPNDIRGPFGPKVSRHLSYRWGKTPKKPNPGNLSRPGIEPGPAAWQARMLPLAPQRWTIYYCKINKKMCVLKTARPKCKFLWRS